MKSIKILVALCCLVIAGRQPSILAAEKPDIDVEIINSSTGRLEDSQVRFGLNVCEWGIVVKQALLLFFPYPITEKAQLSWRRNGEIHVEVLDLRKIYPPGKSGRLTFEVTETTAKARFKEEDQN